MTSSIENFPSLLGGAPCKGMRTFWIDEVDPENGSFRIASDAIVNTDQAIKQFIELIQSNLPEEDRRKPIDSSQIPIIMAQIKTTLIYTPIPVGLSSSITPERHK